MLEWYITSYFWKYGANSGSSARMVTRLRAWRPGFNSRQRLGFYSRQWLGLFSSPPASERLWGRGAPSLLSNGYRWLFSRGKAARPWSWPLISIWREVNGTSLGDPHPLCSRYLQNSKPRKLHAVTDAQNIIVMLCMLCPTTYGLTGLWAVHNKQCALPCLRLRALATNNVWFFYYSSYLIIYLYLEVGGNIWVNYDMWFAFTKYWIFPIRHSVQTDFGSHSPSCPVGNSGSFPRDKAVPLKLTVHLHLALRLRMCGAILQLPHTSSWRGV